MDMNKVKLYRDLRAEAKRLGAEADGIKERADELERELLEEFAEEGCQNVKTDDGSTVFLRREIWAAREDGVDDEVLNNALRAAGLEHMITHKANSQTLSKYLRELDETESPMHPALEGVIKPSEKFAIRINNSSKK